MLVTTHTPIVIYGAGEVGCLCAEALLEKEFNVIAALDMKKENEELVKNVWIYKFGNEPFTIDEREKMLVIVCLADGMLHKNVADKLFEKGYKYISFLPMRHSICMKKKSELTSIYNKILVASEDLEEITIEAYDTFYYPELQPSDCVLNETQEGYTVYMPMEMLFSESLDLWKGDKSKLFAKEEYRDRNIGAQYRNENLWDYFALQADNCEEYFNGFRVKKTEEERQKELEKREALYNVFQKEYNGGLEFFIQGAPYVVWNPKKYFNLVGGHHRTTFLLSKDHSLFPVRISKTDFETWYNIEKYKELMCFFKENKIEKTYAPVPHPALISFPSECEYTGKNKLRAVLKFFGLQSLQEYSVLDISEGEGYFARNMLRCGAKSAEYSTKNAVNLELTRKINDLLYVDNVRTKLEDNDLAAFDLVFFMDEANGISEKTDGEQLVENLSKITKAYLFCEVNNNKDKEYVFKNGGFSEYEEIHKEYRKGKIWTTVVFRK